MFGQEVGHLSAGRRSEKWNSNTMYGTLTAVAAHG